VRAARALGALLALGAAVPAALAEGPRTEIEAWTGREKLTRGYSPWTDTGVALEHRTGARQFFGARLRETERFDARDREAGLAAYQPLGAGWAASLDFTASDTHRVLARRALLGQVERSFGAGWGAQLGLKRSRYVSELGSDTAELRLLTVERYVGDHRIAYTFYSGRLEEGGSAPSHRVQWSVYLAERSSLGVSAASGREVESVAPGTLVSTDVRNLSVFGRYAFHRDWAASAEASSHRQGDLYRRNGLRLGLRYGF
jgi:YaiO family outer membrane protein